MREIPPLRDGKKRRPSGRNDLFVQGMNGEKSRIVKRAPGVRIAALYLAATLTSPGGSGGGGKRRAAR